MLDFIASWNWFDWTVGVWVCFYFVLMWFLIMGLARLKRSVPLPDDECMPVTVLVSARNEEEDLQRCLDAILKLDYPKDKLQIVLVNDFSTDATGDIMERVARNHAHVVVLHAAAMPPNGLEAKARGIAHGFTRATGEWVVITDADVTEGGRMQIRHNRRMLRYNAEQLWRNLIKQGWQRVPPQW